MIGDLATFEKQKLHQQNTSILIVKFSQPKNTHKRTKRTELDVPRVFPSGRPVSIVLVVERDRLPGPSKPRVVVVIGLLRLKVNSSTKTEDHRQLPPFWLA